MLFERYPYGHYLCLQLKSMVFARNPARAKLTCGRSRIEGRLGGRSYRVEAADAGHPVEDSRGLHKGRQDITASPPFPTTPPLLEMVESRGAAIFSQS